MTDKEKIKQEIERLINDKTDGKHVAKADVIAPKRSAYLDILNVINSLPEEPTVKGISWKDVNILESLIYQVHNEYPSIGEKSFGLEVLERFQDCQDGIEEPASEDLEKEFHSWMRENCDDNGFFNQLELARHFAEWGRNHFEDKSEMVSEDFYEAANQHSKQVFHGLLVENNITAFKAGAEWQKQKDLEALQIEYEKGLFDMREAMMKDAVEGRVQCGYGDGNKLSIKAMLPQDSDLKYADKVKVLILKTE